MNEKELFEQGCFLPSWTEAIESKESISNAYAYRNKDVQTLQTELNEIKEYIQDIQERQWNLAKLLHFHENSFARD